MMGVVCGYSDHWGDRVPKAWTGVFVGGGAAGTGGGGEAGGTTFVVTKTADTADGVCDGDCSLREAIIAANAAAGVDTVAFNIPGAGPHTIRPTSPLPIITDSVIIDG